MIRHHSLTPIGVQISGITVHSTRSKWTILGPAVQSGVSSWRGRDELRDFLRCRSRMRQHVPAATRRLRHMRRTAIALGILEAA